MRLLRFYRLFFNRIRAGWLGSLTALGALGLLFGGGGVRNFLIMLIIIPLLGSSVLVTGYFYSDTFQRRMEPVVQFIAGQAEGGIGSESRDFRPQTWADTLVMIDEEPLGVMVRVPIDIYPEFRERFKGERIVPAIRIMNI